MPIVSSGLSSSPYTQDDIEASPESVRSAVFEQAKNDLVGPSILRAMELNAAGSNFGRAGGAHLKKYSADEAKQYMTEAGLDGHFSFDRDYNQLELKKLADRKQAELKRQSILSRADRSASATAGRFGLQLVTSFLDPLTVATAFVPVVGEAKYAQLLGKAGGALGRAGVRAGVGATEGAVGSALVEPIIAGAKYQEQADYHLSDSLLNIAIGGVFGGGLHTIGGAIKDVFNPRAVELAAKIDEIVPAVEPLNTELLGRIDAARGELSAANIEALRVANELLDRESSGLNAVANSPEAKALEGRWSGLETELTNVRSTFDNMAAQVSKLREPEALKAEIERVTADSTYMAYLRKRYNAGDVSEHIERRAKQLIKAQRKEAESQLNDLRTQMADTQRKTDAIRQAESAKVRLEQLRVARKAGDVESLLDALPQDVEPRIRQRLIEAKQAATDFLSSDAVKAIESQRAAAQVAASTPDVREAALKSTVAQAVTGQSIEARPIYDRSTLKEAAARLNDPDQKPMSDPAASQHADSVIRAGETADDAVIEKQVQELDEQLKAMELDAVQSENPEFAEIVSALRDELAETDKVSRESTGFARQLAACAMRSA